MYKFVNVCLCFLLFSFQFQANSHNWDVFSTDDYNIMLSYDMLLQKV